MHLPQSIRHFGDLHIVGIQPCHSRSILREAKGIHGVFQFTAPRIGKRCVQQQIPAERKRDRNQQENRKKQPRPKTDLQLFHTSRR